MTPQKQGIYHTIYYGGIILLYVRMQNNININLICKFGYCAFINAVEWYRGMRPGSRIFSSARGISKMATQYKTTAEINTMGLAVYNVLPVESDITASHIFTHYALKITETLQGHNIYIYEILSCNHAVLKHTLRRKRDWVKIDGIKKWRPVYEYVKSENKIIDICTTMKPVHNQIYNTKREYIPHISHNGKLLIINQNNSHCNYKLYPEIVEYSFKLAVYHELETAHKLTENNLL